MNLLYDDDSKITVSHDGVLLFCNQIAKWEVDILFPDTYNENVNERGPASVDDSK